MAPSQHLRSTLARTRTSRLAFPTAVVLGATVALSGCGAQEAGAAAIVNDTVGDTVISDRDVQKVADQINALSQGKQTFTSTEVLYVLILAPFFSDEAERTHKTVSASEARKAIEKVADPSPATIEFVRMQLASQRLDETSGPFIVSALRKAKITINPRYGTYDAKKLVISASSPNWFKASAPSSAK